MKLVFPAIFFGFLVSCRSEPDSYTVFPEGKRTDTLALRYDTLGFIRVTVTVDGKAYDFLFDTGAFTTVLDSKIPIQKHLGEGALTDVFGDEYSAAKVSIPMLGVGDIRFYHQPRYLQRDLYDDGILGGNILRKMAWKLDFGNRNIIAAYDAGSFGLKKENGIPLRLSGGRLWFTSYINGVPVPMCLDTGFDGFVTAPQRILDSIQGVSDQAIAWHGLTNSNLHNPFQKKNYVRSHDSTWYIMGAFQVGTRTLSEEVIEFRNRNNFLVGLDFLMRFDHVVIDYPGRMLYLGSEQPKSVNYLREISMNLNTMGVQLTSDPIPLISRLTSLSQVKGLRIGDTVVSINGISFIDPELEHFDKSIYPRSGALAKLPGFEKVPPFRDILTANFTNLSPYSTMTVKRGDSTWTVRLLRYYAVRELPERVSIFTGLPSDLMSLATGGTFEVAPTGITGSVRSRQPPANPYGEGNSPDWSTTPYYYY